MSVLFVDSRVNIGVWQSVIPNVQSNRPKVTVL